MLLCRGGQEGFTLLRSLRARAALRTPLAQVTGGCGGGDQVVSVDTPKAGVCGVSFILSFIHQVLSTIFHVPGTVLCSDDKVINKT